MGAVGVGLKIGEGFEKKTKQIKKVCEMWF
jgi:hypothetical protein